MLHDVHWFQLNASVCAVERDTQAGGMGVRRWRSRRRKCLSNRGCIIYFILIIYSNNRASTADLSAAVRAGALDRRLASRLGWRVDFEGLRACAQLLFIHTNTRTHMQTTACIKLFKVVVVCLFVCAWHAALALLILWGEWLWRTNS